MMHMQTPAAMGFDRDFQSAVNFGEKEQKRPLFSGR
jgi:hypothetical protein